MVGPMPVSPREIIAEESLDLMYKKMNDNEIHITTDLLAWVGMHALIPYNLIFRLQHAVYLSNPLQGLLYHFVIEDVLCYGMETVEIHSKLPGDKGHSTEEHNQYLLKTKNEAGKMTDLINEYCASRDINVPAFREFYFQPLEEGENDAGTADTNESGSGENLLFDEFGVNGDFGFNSNVGEDEEHLSEGDEEDVSPPGFAMV